MRPAGVTETAAQPTAPKGRVWFRKKTKPTAFPPASRMLHNELAGGGLARPTQGNPRALNEGRMPAGCSVNVAQHCARRLAMLGAPALTTFTFEGNWIRGSGAGATLSKVSL